MAEIDANAAPGDLVHITEEQLHELYDFNRKFEGIGQLSRVYEEITHQQHQSMRWFAAYDTQRRLAFMWRTTFLATALGLAVGQILRSI